MFDESRNLEQPQKNSVLSSFRSAKETANETDAVGNEEDACPAFGYLRGIRDRALALQLRYRNGNSDWFSYSLLGSWRYNPSVGILLKFSGYVVSLVLIRGSNLDALVNKNSMNLTDRGIQRHRVTWVREMEEDELGKAGNGEPTIDRFEVAEFETNEDAMEWLKSVAPVFAR